MMKTSFALLAFIAASVSFGTAAVVENPVTGNPGLGQIDCLSFAPEGVLLIGDGKKQQIVAVVTGDTTPANGQVGDIKGFRKELAGRLGVQPADVEVLDLAVNPASGRVYVAARKQDDKTYVLLKLSPGGAIDLVDLTKVSYARVPLPAGDTSPVNAISDVAWAGNKLVAAARCSEEFASKIFAANGPLKHDQAGQIYSAETFHVAHNKWETKAPMNVMLPYVENGKHYIVGAFSCTPVVKYPIDAVEPGAKIKGISMIELGSGNKPLDMFAYEKDGKGSVLTNTFRFHHEKRPFGPSPHLAFRFDEELLGKNDAVNEKAVRRLDEKAEAAKQIEIAEPFHGVVQMDRLNEKTALALREAPDSDLDLVAIALP